MAAVVTSGRAYTDIDAFACAVALAEALSLAGAEALAVLPGEPNLSVPPDHHRHPAFTQPEPRRRHDVILVDISDPKHLARFVDPNRVRAVFDHHLGFEDYWRSRGARTVIEPIGAAATLVWEEVTRLGVASSLSNAALGLLAEAILSNTVGLTSTWTAPRDRIALAELEAAAGLSGPWREAHFEEVEKRLLDNLDQALTRDTKAVTLDGGKTVSIGQIELSSAKAAERVLQLICSGRRAVPDLTVIPVRTANTTYVVATDPSLLAPLAREYRLFEQKRAGAALIVTLPDILLRKTLLANAWTKVGAATGGF